ncbi:Ulp1 family isopeptidase, partial [Xanthomonas fragariae]
GFQGRLFKFSTSGQRKIVERAMRNRRRSCVGSRLKTVFNSLKSGVIETLYKNPDLLLDMAKKLSDNTLGVKVATNGQITEKILAQLVDETNGDLTALGEKVISAANASIQTAIRFNLKRRYQPSAPPANSPPELIQQEQNSPNASFFSGVSTLWCDMGYEGEPSTPHSPPKSTASTFSGHSSLNGREFGLNIPLEVEQPCTPHRYDAMHAPVEQSLTPAMSPGRIDVDDMPTPQSTEGSGLQGLTHTSWLGDEHLYAYTQALAHRLEGKPNAQLLNFADPLQVALLISGDDRQKHDVLRHLAGADTPPIVFLPINNPEFHWSLLVIDWRTGEALHYASSLNPEHAKYATTTAQYRLASEAAQAMGIRPSSVRPMPIAQQQNSHSCGDHVLTGIEVLAHSVIKGTFEVGLGKDLRNIAPDRGRIADLLTGAEQFRTESLARKAPESPVEQ